jgi:hypothetical protein
MFPPQPTLRKGLLANPISGVGDFDGTGLNWHRRTLISKVSPLFASAIKSFPQGWINAKSSHSSSPWRNVFGCPSKVPHAF